MGPGISPKLADAPRAAAISGEDSPPPGMRSVGREDIRVNESDGINVLASNRTDRREPWIIVGQLDGGDSSHRGKLTN
jgi:hypothetical protein